MTTKVTLPKLISAGANLCEQGKWRDAISIFERCLQINPKYIDALYNLGVCYANLGDFRQALQYYQQVLKLNSMDIEVTYNCGVAFSQLGNLSEAINAYQKTLEIDERYLAAWVNLATCYCTKGLILLKEPYKKISGRPVPVDGEDLRTFFAISSWSDEGLEYLRQTLKEADKAVEYFQLAVECLEEAIKRSDSQSLERDLKQQRESLKMFGV